MCDQQDNLQLRIRKKGHVFLISFISKCLQGGVKPDKGILSPTTYQINLFERDESCIKWWLSRDIPQQFLCPNKNENKQRKWWKKKAHTHTQQQQQQQNKTKNNNNDNNNNNIKSNNNK